MRDQQDEPEIQEIESFVDSIEKENTINRLQRWLDNAGRNPGEEPVKPSGRHRSLGTGARSEG